MSKKVRIRLRELGIPATHDERVEIDKEIERRTGINCDVGIKEITDEELKEIAALIKKRKKKKKKEAIACAV